MSRYDDPWDFTVTWDPDKGALPMPILRLFRCRSTVTPGKATHRTDKGHSTFYVGAVTRYLDRMSSEHQRPDISADAYLADLPPE